LTNRENSCSTKDSPLRKSSKRRSSTRFNMAWYYVLPGLLVLILVTLGPFIYMISQSFYKWGIGSEREFTGFGNYLAVIVDPKFWFSIRVSIFFVVAGLLLSHLFGLILTLLLSAIKKWRGLFLVLFCIPMVLPPITAAMIWKLLYRPNTGIINYLLRTLGLPGPTWLGSYGLAPVSLVIVDAWQWAPFIMLILSGGINTITKEIYEAAEVDGASGWDKLMAITFPLLKPFFFLTFFLRFIWIFTTFDLIAGLTQGGPGNATVTLYYYTYLKTYDFFRIGEGAALSIVIFLIVFGVSMILLKKLVKRRM